MSKSKSIKKKVVVTTQKKKAAPTTSKRKATSSQSSKPVELLFGRQNYIWMGIGVGFIALGLILMLGGDMPSADVWDDNIIYSWRRTTLAPLVIIIGLCIEIYAIFKKDK